MPEIGNEYAENGNIYPSKCIKVNNAFMQRRKCIERLENFYATETSRYEIDSHNCRKSVGNWPEKFW